MSAPSITSLRDLLRLGLSVFSELWNYKAKNWITGVHAADIDNDGDIEIITSSRDGRVRALTKEGMCRWERVIGRKDWVGPIIGLSPVKGSDNRVRIIT